MYLRRGAVVLDVSMDWISRRAAKRSGERPLGGRLGTPTHRGMKTAKAQRSGVQRERRPRVAPLRMHSASLFGCWGIGGCPPRGRPGFGEL